MNNTEYQLEPDPRVEQLKRQDREQGVRKLVESLPPPDQLTREHGIRKLVGSLPPPDQLTLEKPKPKPTPTSIRKLVGSLPPPDQLTLGKPKPKPKPTRTITLPGANWWERRLTDAHDGIKYAKYMADKNKFTKWLFDTRDVALPPAGNDWEWDMFHPKNMTSKFPDSRLEDLAEWVPNIHTAIATNTDDFITDYGVDTYEGDYGDPIDVYEKYSKHTQPPKKPQFGNYRKPRTITLPK